MNTTTILAFKLLDSLITLDSEIELWEDFLEKNREILSEERITELSKQIQVSKEAAAHKRKWFNEQVVPTF